MDDYLSVRTSDRGFDGLPPLPGAYGGEVRVYESSAALAPHIWLDASTSPIHLTAEDAWKLARQLDYLVEHHYQGDARPEVDRD